MAFSITACQPTANTSNPKEKISAGISTATEKPSSQEPFRKPPLPVEMFEMYCYRNTSNFERIVALSELSKLSPAPKELNQLIATESSAGRAFVIEKSKDPERLMLLGVTKANTCSIFASGYDIGAIQESMQENYHLKSIMTDDTGLQINEMLVPNGTTGTVFDTHENGVIGIIYLKDPKSQDVTISFVPPEVAKQVFKL